jgi:hypothetical protein
MRAGFVIEKSGMIVEECQSSAALQFTVDYGMQFKNQMLETGDACSAERMRATQVMNIYPILPTAQSALTAPMFFNYP